MSATQRRSSRPRTPFDIALGDVLSRTAPTGRRRLRAGGRGAVPRRVRQLARLAPPEVRRCRALLRVRGTTFGRTRDAGDPSHVSAVEGAPQRDDRRGSCAPRGRHSERLPSRPRLAPSSSPQRGRGRGLPERDPVLLATRDAPTVPVVCLIFHVHQDQFASYFRWPVAHIGRWLEGPVSRIVYGRRAIAVISPSTRAGVRNRLNLRGAMHVVPCGAEPCTGRGQGETVTRAREPRIVCVGRLVAHKRMHLLIQATPEVLVTHPDLKVAIVGSGAQLETLRAEAEGLGLAGTIEFHGQVSNDRREQLLREAWLTVNPSAGEGWGLSVIEANACGVPAVAFRVPGLQDSIVSGRTGWLVNPHTALGPVIGEAINTLRNPHAAEEWSRRVRSWAARFSWDATATRLLDVIAQEEERLLRDAQVPGDDQRCQSDLACHVSLPADIVPVLPARGVEPPDRRVDQQGRAGRGPDAGSRRGGCALCAGTARPGRARSGSRRAACRLVARRRSADVSAVRQ